MLNKILLIVLLQIVFTLVLSFFAGLLVLLQIKAGYSQALITVTTTAFISAFSTYFAMLLISAKFIISDVKLVPLWLAIIALGWGLATTATNWSFFNSFINIAVSPILQYLVSYLFLRNKFKSER